MNDSYSINRSYENMLYDENKEQYEQTLMDTDGDSHLFTIDNSYKTNNSTHILIDKNIDCVSKHNDNDEEMLTEDAPLNNNNNNLSYKIKISNQLIDLDQVTSQLINKMTKQEKESYAYKCMQLYMAMYE